MIGCLGFIVKFVVFMVVAALIISFAPWLVGVIAMVALWKMVFCSK